MRYAADRIALENKCSVEQAVFEAERILKYHSKVEAKKKRSKSRKEKSKETEIIDAEALLKMLNKGE